MPRGRAARYDDQRDVILQRAAELFARQGYTATTMNQVAAACRVTKPTLYHYWPDKHALLAQICEAHVRRLQALVAEVCAEVAQPDERLRRLILRFVEAYADAQHEHRVLTEDVKFLEPEAAQRVLDAQREVVAAFARAVAEVRPAMGRAGLDKALAMLLFGMINWMFTWLRPEGALSHADMAPLVADLFFGGLNAVRARPVRAVRAPRMPRAPGTPRTTRSSRTTGDTRDPSSPVPTPEAA